MDILSIQNSIKNKLEQSIQDLKIESFPSGFQDYLGRFTHAKGAILVHYAGSDYTEPDNHNLIEQLRKSEFDIYIILKNLLKPDDACDYLENIRDILTGYEIEGCEKIYPVNDNFILEQNGIWIYVIRFALLIPVEEN